MSPMGVLLRYLRNQKGVALKVMAAELGISERILSALETGRRGPPNEEDLLKIKKILRLTEEEFSSLVESARCSSSHVRIPIKARPLEYRLMHRLAAAIGGGLTDQQIAAIQATLDSTASGILSENRR